MNIEYDFSVGYKIVNILLNSSITIRASLILMLVFGKRVTTDRNSEIFYEVI